MTKTAIEIDKHIGAILKPSQLKLVGTLLVALSSSSSSAY
jgi:hypothetical protein